MTNRVWFTRKMQMGKNDLEDAHITQINASGEPVTRWYAKTAVFDPRDDKWLLIQGRKVNFDNQGNIAGEIEDWSKEYGARSTRVMKNWSETPYRIASSTMEAEQLTVPQLRTYLAQNADFPEPQLAAFRTHLQYRWALPLTCLSVVFIAAPLGIVFSRRAVLASVASSIFIFFGYLFLMFLMLALGKGNHVSPLVAGWLPNALLLIIGCYLLFLRSTNRDLPKISFRRK
jgi:lipopolysaccharide export LptBFGC system permease protein LptF